MELRRYIRLLLRRWVLIAVTVIVALAVGYALAPHQATTYSSSSTVLVGPRSYTTGGPGGGNLPTTNQAAGLNTLVITYSHLVDTAPVAAQAIRATGAPRSVGQVLAETSASAVQYTQLITISVKDPSPQVAQELATGMADAFVAQVGTGAGATGGRGTGSGAAPAISLESFGPAGPAGASVAPGHKRDVAVAGIFGLLVAVALAVLVEYLDVTVKDPEEAERRLGAPLLATVPAFPQLGASPARRVEPAPAGAEVG